LRYAPTFERFVAGAESNFAVGMVRLGHRVGWISRVGTDEFGECILTFLRGEGVDVSRVQSDPDAPTGVFFKERRRANATRVYYYRAGSAASRLSPDDVPPDYIRGARCVHLTGVTPALGASCQAALDRAIAVAREANVPVSFDPNVRLKLWSADAARSTLLELLERVDWLLVGQEEARLLTGEPDPEKGAEILLERGPSVVVVKLGAEGALGSTSAGILHSPAVPVEAVEATGAGDAFDAGFVSGQLRGWGLSECLRLGNVLGALATTTIGDVEGLPTWAEVQPYLGAMEEPPR
ncbi:MAG TPA: sugar kinase, partial [Longimicrobiaceae bacterium]|nr:sugar kinase [Longimicrobiaceae bacterium]